MPVLLDVEREDFKMTKKEKMDEMKALVKEINAALVSDDKKVADTVPATLNTLTQAVESYNLMTREEEYNKFLATDRPCFEALKQGDIVQVRIKHVQENPEKGTPEKYELHEVNVLVNLIEFNKHAKEAETYGKTVFNRPSWMVEIEVLTEYLGMRIIKEVEATQDVKDVFKRSSEGTDCEYKQANPTSNRSLQTVCQYITDGIIFEPTKEGGDENCFIFEKKDLKFMLLTMTRKGKKRTTLTMPRVGTVVDLMTEALHRIVNKKSWTLED